MKYLIIICTLFLIIFQGFLRADDYRWKRIIDKATFDISVNPLNHNTFYAGGEGRVVYRSWDGGFNWDTLVVNFKQGYARLNNVLVHPIDTNIIIVGGLNFGIISRCTSNCEDPDSWKVVLSSTSPVALNGKSMVFKPDQPDTIYAGDYMYGIVWRSTNKGETWDSISTVKNTYKYEKKDGTIIDTLLPITVGAIQIREDSTNILVFGSTLSEVFISTDGGFNWKYTDILVKPKLEQSDCEITRIVFSDRDPRVGYACITYLFLDNTNNGGLYKTTDGGYNWFQVAFPDTSIWALDCRGLGDDDEVFIGGYTEDFYMVDSMRVPGAGIVRRSQDGGQTWWSYDPQMDWALRNPKSNSELRSVHFISPDTGYAVGKYGVILRSRDGGAEWSTIFNPGYQFFQDMAFINANSGLLVASTGEIMKTTNGGVLLNEVYNDYTKSFYSIAHINNNNFVACGAKGIILKTTDFGESWYEVESNTEEVLHSVFFVDEFNGWAVGSNGTIITSTNSGENWVIQKSNTLRDIHSVNFYDKNNGFAVGDSGIVLHTTDAGNTWNIDNKFTSYNLHSISFNKFGNKNIGLTIGDMGKAYKTTNAGKDWLELNTKNVRPFYACEVLTDNLYIASGQYNTIIQTQSGGEWWFVNQRGDGPVSNMWSLRFLGEKGKERLFMATEAGLFLLRDPSPVNESFPISNDNNNLALRYNSGQLNIKYELNNSNNFQDLFFRVSDITGKTLHQSNFSSNNTYFEHDLRIHLNPGVYVCQMIEQNSSSVQVIIIR